MLCFSFVQAVNLTAEIAPVSFQSREEQTSLLEIYTSEGCSSCPPAETWLTGLKTAAGLWNAFVPVAFHVDYWDSSGWRDPWATKAFSDRQRVYAQSWHADSVYTPGLVLNGREWRTWFRPKTGPASSGVKSGVLTVHSTDRKHWSASFVPVAAGNSRYEIHAALLGCDLVSDVKGGENRGRRLRHDFVVTALTGGALASSGGHAAGDFTLDTTTAPSRRAVAFWVTAPGDARPVQAIGGWLP